MNDLFNNDQPSYYLPNKGITNSKTQIYNEYLHNAYKQIFRIFDTYELDYYVFAGSAIGYVRNKRNLPWADDYDIIIFEKEKEKFEKVIIPILKKNGYNPGMPHLVRPDLYPRHAGWQITGKRINNITFFLCDVFLTKVDDNGFIRNTGNFGVYHHKNIPVTYVNPKKYVHFDGLRLPFFNEIEEYVKLEYGDVINSVSIYMAHSSGGRININKHWSSVYEDYEKIKKQAVENTLNRIFTNNNYTGSEIKIVRCNSDIGISDNTDNDFVYDEFKILEYINTNNIGTLLVEDEKFLYYCAVIKHYYPKIKIKYYMYKDINVKNIFNLNYVDEVYCSNQTLLDLIDDPDIMYLYKPKIKIITVITFGTFDLFHYGHDNLFKRAETYGSTLIVGVSSDEFNKEKGKTSANNLTQRMKDVEKNIYVDAVFVEESLEEKDNYIKNYKGDLLIMGDDWKDKFDWVSCMTKYLPRTPGISSKMLKENINNIQNEQI